MNTNLEKLIKITKQPYRFVLGLMSGTSLDGLDLALVKFSNSNYLINHQLCQFTTIPYSTQLVKNLKKIISNPQSSILDICLWNAQLARVHAQLVLQTLKKWKIAANEIDLLGSHGQTIFHAPQTYHNLKNFPNSTWQIVDGNHLAHLTQIITCCDFRQSLVSKGYEGAPLAIYGDFFLASSSKENRILLNIGGISNFTFLPSTKNFSATFATDTGPGNCLLDALAQYYFKVPFDKNGQLAKKGQLNNRLLEILLRHPFCHKPLPKTTGLETFNIKWLQDILHNPNFNKLNNHDILNTITHFTALTIAKSILLSSKDFSIYISGGGSHNSFLVSLIKKYLNIKKIASTDKIGLNADAKEAVIFAFLANELVMGNPLCQFGKICFP